MGTGTPYNFKIIAGGWPLFVITSTTQANMNTDWNSIVSNNNNLDKRKKTDVLSFISRGHK